MQQQRHLTGQGAGVEKYDLITALAVNGLAAGGSKQTTMMRLIALLTARYNWAKDEVVIGQREMASLWSVDERTAKRETRRLIEAGLLSIKRPGIRGRVASYHVDRNRIYALTQDDWNSVGPDYSTRMTAKVNETKNFNIDEKVIPLPVLPRSKNHDTAWDRSMALLATDQPQLYEAWFSKLVPSPSVSENILVLIAPTKFVASYISSRLMAPLERAVQFGYGSLIRCKIEALSV